MQTEQQRLAEKALALKLANQEARPLSLSEILDLLKRANEENHLRILSFGEIVEILGCSKKGQEDDRKRRSGTGSGVMEANTFDFEAHLRKVREQTQGVTEVTEDRTPWP